MLTRPRVVFKHYRYKRQQHGWPTLEHYYRSRKGRRKPFDPLPCGGKTLCALEIDGKLYLGYADCAIDDNFSFKEGSQRAFDNAYAEYAKKTLEGGGFVLEATGKGF